MYWWCIYLKEVEILEMLIKRKIGKEIQWIKVKKSNTMIEWQTSRKRLGTRRKL